MLYIIRIKQTEYKEKMNCPNDYMNTTGDKDLKFS